MTNRPCRFDNAFHRTPENGRLSTLRHLNCHDNIYIYIERIWPNSLLQERKNCRLFSTIDVYRWGSFREFRNDGAFVPVERFLAVVVPLGTR